MLRKSQIKKALQVELIRKADQNILSFDLNPKKAGADLQVINELLGLSADMHNFFLTIKLIKTPNAFVIKTRLLREIFYYLSHATSVGKAILKAARHYHQECFG